MFNAFAKQYLNSHRFVGDQGKRFKAMGWELLYNLSVFFPWLVILSLPTLIFRKRPGIGETIPSDSFLFDLLFFVPPALLYFAILNKDFFNGQSVVNRLLGYQIVNNKTMKPASSLRCMLRNVLAPVWPIEVIFVLFSPSRRLGDFIAGTKIVDVQVSDPELILTAMEQRKLDADARATLLASIVVLALYAAAKNVLLDI